MLRLLLALAGLCELMALRFERSMPNCSYAWSAVHGDEDPNMVAYTALSETFMEVVAPNDKIDETEAPWTEIVTWMDAILIDVMGCVDRSDPLCAESEDHCVCQASPGLIHCCPFGVSAIGGGSLSPSSLVPSSVGDPHITSITGEKFDLWKFGWSTFMQVPQQAETDDDVKLLVQGKVQRFWGSDECAPAFLDQVHISGSWVGNRTVQIFSGSLESEKNFTVSIDNGPRRKIDDADGTTFLLDPSVSVTGEIVSQDPKLWRPDAMVVLDVGNVNIEVVQHTEGRFEESMAMLDISVSDIDKISDTVGGWLGVDGAEGAGEAPPECAMQRPELSAINELAQSGRASLSSKASFVSRLMVKKTRAASRKKRFNEYCLS
jgi:hypothetical protein